MILEKLSIKYDVPKRWILSDSLLIKTLITNRNKTSEIINTIKQKITDTERDELEKILHLKRKIKNKNLIPKKD